MSNQYQNSTILLSDPIAKSPFLNHPEIILRELAEAQAIIEFQNNRISILKNELDQLLHLGTIENNITFNGINAKRCTKQGKWIYSEFCNELAKDYKNKLEKQMEKEREDKIAVQSPEFYYWRIKRND